MTDPTGSPSDEERDGTGHRTESARDAAQRIWLAGLGALSRAQQEGSKLFDALVREGSSAQRKAQDAAGDMFSSAGNRFSGVAEELSQRTAESREKVGSFVEQRVAEALDRMGVARVRELEALQARIDQLERAVARLSNGRGGAGNTHPSASDHPSAFEDPERPGRRYPDDAAD